MSLLEATEVSKQFAGIRALDRVDLTVEEGDFVGLIGPNGAGKTTLFNCINGTIPVSTGTVRFAGADITTTAAHRRSRLGLARTFQRLELFTGMTVRDHLLVAARARRTQGSILRDLVGLSSPTPDERADTDEILDLVGLAGDADRPVEALPLGRGRLVELGRALVTRPRLLFLDEPSSGLDTAETEVMGDVLIRARAERGCTILLVEHDLALVRRVTEKLVVLDVGRLIASGGTAEVLAEEPVRRAYLGDLP
ncbi:MAG: ABC transporter ATP-binding protein [Acidimicrobiia bacterium]|nr:ABC transporter ATP-binding protein [Acidimicrobiia bacterium]